MRWIGVAGLVLLSIARGQAIEKAGEFSDQDTNADFTAESPAVTQGELEREQSNPDRKSAPEIVRFGGDVTIGAGEEARDVVVIFGTLRIVGRVRGDVVVVGGRTIVDGRIEGNLVMPFGKLDLGPGAEVEGDVVAVLGEMNADPRAYIGGQRFELTASSLESHLPPMEGMRRWVMEGLVLARPLPHEFGWWWWFALACALFYLVTALVFSRPIAFGVNALETRPVGSFFLGLMMFMVFGPLLLLLLATGVGLLVIPFVVCGGLAAFVLGKVVVYEVMGRQIGRQTGLGFLQIPLVALIVGVGLFYAMYVIPVIGLMVWLLAGLLGLGAVVLAFFDAFRKESAVVQLAVAQPPALALSADTAGEGITPPLIPGQPPVPPLVEPSSLVRVGFWLRFLATFIDLLLVAAVTATIQRASWFLPLWVAYHVGFWSWRGTTIGGVVLGLKIVRRDGRDLDFPIALIRSLSSFLSAMALFVGFFWAGWSRNRVSWHDQIAGTIVVRMPRKFLLF